MTYADQTCDVCQGESGGAFVGVASVPGAPVSIAWCRACLARDAAPSWVFDHDYIFVAQGNLAALHDWARQRVTWDDGRYVGFDEYCKRWTPARIAEAWADYERACDEAATREGGVE